MSQVSTSIRSISYSLAITTYRRRTHSSSIRTYIHSSIVNCLLHGNTTILLQSTRIGDIARYITRSKRTLWMTSCKIVAANRFAHWTIVWMVMMPCTIRTNRMMIMMPITVIPIDKWIYTIVRVPPTWPMAPIIRRMPTYPC